MSCIEWNESYNLGILVIDQQHQHLIAIMNDLCDALDKNNDKAMVEAALGEMADYAQTHFGLEEKYFDEFGYEKAEAHMAAHKVFAEKTLSLKKDLGEGKDTVTSEAITFLGNWFIKHIQGLDREYVETFHKHGIK